MAWHDRTPWAARAAQQTRVVDEIAAAIDTFRKGGASFNVTRKRIEDLLDGDAKVIRVPGKQHNPEVQS